MTADHGSEEFPTAKVSETPPLLMRLGRSRMWWLTLACVIGAIGFFAVAQRGKGPGVKVSFAEGHGLKRGDAVRYRGIDVGQVEGLRLSEGAAGVMVQLRLNKEAATLAREGTRAWIVRPQVSLARVSGLETVVGANYVQLAPNHEGARTDTFDGLDAPPVLKEATSASITLTFEDVHGLAVGDPLRYRGVDLGEVRDIDLKPKAEHITVTLALTERGAEFAVEGSQFWIERPRISLTEVKGVGAALSRYVAVAPGKGKPQSSFEGLAEAPAVSAAGLEVQVHAPARYGLEVGSPVLFRGVLVGKVSEVHLAPDGSRVLSTLWIEARYRYLVRTDSRFWSTSGVRVNLGWSGVEVAADSLNTVAAGGVAFATPDEPGGIPQRGHRFRLFEKVDED